MDRKNLKLGVWLLILVSLGVGSRWIPHPPNFAALLAVAIFAGRALPGPWALAAPILSAVIGDLWLGLHDQMWIVYLSLLPLPLLGLALPNIKGRKASTWGTWLGLGLVGNIIFFVTTNLGVWLTTDLYPRTIEGLVTAYAMAIPFFHNSILSTWIYLGALEVIYLGLPVLFPWFATAAAARATSSASPK
jgi:hypothetical protein